VAAVAIVHRARRATTVGATEAIAVTAAATGANARVTIGVVIAAATEEVAAAVAADAAEAAVVAVADMAATGGR
jgi:hypothetical protein